MVYQLRHIHLHVDNMFIVVSRGAARGLSAYFPDCAVVSSILAPPPIHENRECILLLNIVMEITIGWTMPSRDTIMCIVVWVFMWTHVECSLINMSGNNNAHLPLFLQIVSLDLIVSRRLSTVQYPLAQGDEQILGKAVDWRAWGIWAATK
jgi:hypothetical protein